MSKHAQILDFLKELRQSNPVIEEIYLLGSCLNLFHVLKVFFPESTCYYGHVPGHVITKIDDRYYDITGEIKNVCDYVPIKEIWTHKYKDEASLKSGKMYDPTCKAKYKRIVKL